MARYIEKEALINFLDEQGYFKHAIYKSVIEDFPTADVVPKSEVEKIFEEIEKNLNRKIARSKPQFEKLKNRDEDFLSKWGYEDMGYFKGIISTCEDIQDIIAELKKKYTESEDK